MDWTAPSLAQTSHYIQINVDILKTQQKKHITKGVITYVKILNWSQSDENDWFCLCDDSSHKVQVEQIHVIARQLQCNKCLIGLFTLLCTALHMTFCTVVPFLPQAWSTARWEKKTRLQLWCELFLWALGIINQPLQYRGHEEVAVITKVLKEA